MSFLNMHLLNLSFLCLIITIFSNGAHARDNKTKSIGDIFEVSTCREDKRSYLSEVSCEPQKLPTNTLCHVEITNSQAPTEIRITFPGVQIESRRLFQKTREVLDLTLNQVERDKLNKSTSLFLAGPKIRKGALLIRTPFSSNYQYAAIYTLSRPNKNTDFELNEVSLRTQVQASNQITTWTEYKCQF